MEPDEGVFNLVGAPNDAVEYVSVLLRPFVTFACVGVDELVSLAFGTDDAEPAGKVGVCKAGSTALSAVCLPCAHP
jgi:hypothetical protein